jgi:hypothetical protein
MAIILCFAADFEPRAFGTPCARKLRQEGIKMESIVGIFNSFADAKRAAALLRSRRISENHMSVLSPRSSETEIEDAIPTTETEQPGMGAAVGGTVGAALGVAGGLEAGAAAASLLIPGVGPVLAIGLIGAAIFGVGGAAAGALAGQALEQGMANGIPRDELYIYEDALRRGRSLVFAFVEDAQTAGRARTELSRAGAESVDAARDEWWVGLRSAEREHYLKQGGNFDTDEAKYRLGFEAAMHPECRGKSCDDIEPQLKKKYGEDAQDQPFRAGYARGQHYLSYVGQVSNHSPREDQGRRGDKEHSQRAA